MVTDMDKDQFLKTFGGIFEHSAWIAERAFDSGLGADQETASGLHQLMCQFFRSASEEERLGVLKAHPDLAGRLAVANQLTQESTNEQASAGLDQLTPEEHARFTELNTAYTEKFGFPYILAVKGRNRHEILQNFETRIDNTRDEEFSEACQQVEQIALLRLKDILPD